MELGGVADARADIVPVGDEVRDNCEAREKKHPNVRGELR